jgi:hypothetical protein
MRIQEASWMVPTKETRKKPRCFSYHNNSQVDLHD